jgi:deoxycytidine triphosphate deaminase
MSQLEHGALNDSLDAAELDERLIVMPLLDRKKQVGPATIDLRLGTEFIEVDLHAEVALDPATEAHPADLRRRERTYEVPFGEHLVLHPGQFVLGATLEFVRMPLHLGGQVLGRSSWGRLGLIVATAVVVQPGFGGCLTLELANSGSMPILLYPGLRVAQLQVWRLTEKTDTGYPEVGQFNVSLGPQSAKLGWEAAELSRLRRIGRRLQGLSD